jgi:hypothetical protein
MRVAVIAAVLGLAGTASANPYEAFIDIESQDDLDDLFASQQISDETYNTLLDLLQRGVDLNTASREELYSLPNLTYDDVDAILFYREEQGFIRDPAELSTAKVLTDDQLLAIAAFLIVRDPFAGLSKVHGFASLQTRFTVQDDLAPPLALRARLSIGKHITAGFVAAESRLRVDDVRYDPNRDALLADEPGVSAQVPKAYVSYETEQLHGLAGSFRIGFGQRLTFDDSSDYAPNGIYRDDQIFRDQTLSHECNIGDGEYNDPMASPCYEDHQYVTPDFAWREALFGVAAGVKKIPLGTGWLQAYGWGSYQSHSIYQYELYKPSTCADPRDDVGLGCKAPNVYVPPDGDPLDFAYNVQYSTLPDMYAEGIVGANVTYFAQRRSHLGVTSYLSTPHWNVDDLDFQEWSSRPAGGRFGAIGLDAAAGVGKFDLGAEVTQSFDSMEPTMGEANGGGGPAAVVRSAWTVPRRHELEVIARYLSTDFVNPYARPVAAPDEFEGQRARDEAGARTRYTGKLGALGLRTSLDIWTSPSDGVWQTSAFVRGDVKLSKQLGYGAWLDFADKDLGFGGRGQCYDQTFEYDTRGEPIQCKGMRTKLTGRVRWQPQRDLGLQAQAQYALQDDTTYPEGFRQDAQAWVIATYRATDDLRLRGRIRYLTEDLADSKSLEESLWTYLEASQRLRAKDHIRARLDGYFWLDDRDSTAERQPSPELRLWLEYDAKF